jgi:hypothetical protein
MEQDKCLSQERLSQVEEETGFGGEFDSDSELSNSQPASLPTDIPENRHPYKDFQPIYADICKYAEDRDIWAMVREQLNELHGAVIQKAASSRNLHGTVTSLPRQTRKRSNARLRRMHEQDGKKRRNNNDNIL